MKKSYSLLATAMKKSSRFLAMTMKKSYHFLAMVPKKYYLFLAMATLFLAFTEIYSELTTHHFSWPTLAFICECGLLLIIADWLSLKDKVGENREHKHPLLRVGLSVFLLVPFTIYVLVGEQSKSSPALEQFSLLAIAPTLGGLVLAAASIGKFPNEEQYTGLINVAQKLIAATLLFVIFIPVYFLANLNGNIDPNSVDYRHLLSWINGILFWLAVPCFYGGLLLFLLGIIDLAFELGDLIPPKPKEIQPPKEPTPPVDNNPTPD